MRNKILTALWCASGALFATDAAGATGHWFMAPLALALYFGLSAQRWKIERAERHADDWCALYAEACEDLARLRVERSAGWMPSLARAHEHYEGLCATLRKIHEAEAAQVRSALPFPEDEWRKSRDRATMVPGPIGEDVE